LFALANAGVSFEGVRLSSFSEGISLGIMLGLVVGKPVGIVLFSWFAVRAGLGALPAGVRMAHVLGIGLLGGIGFTMALFVGDLAFATDAELGAAKLGILSASTLAACLGLGILWRIGGPSQSLTAAANVGTLPQ
jgi:NhaA family Na+:H+ antiporter